MNDVFIDKKNSATIKGLLILLIVLGHNHVLCPNTVEHGIMGYLYLFHIAGFFILPFFYDIPSDTSWKCISAKIIRTWIPYFWICILCWIAYSVKKHNFIINIELVINFLRGTQTPIRESFGFVFPWFLPTFCSFSILLLYARKYKHLYISLSLTAFILWGLSWENFFVLKNAVPFGVVLAISYFGSGVLAFEFNRRFKYSRYFALLLFILMSMCYWNNIEIGYMYQLFPVAFFMSLLLVVPYINFGFIRLLGNNSLGIYLYHMFFVNITYMMFPKTTIMGIVGFFISLFASLGINMLIYRIHTLRILLYPKNIDEIKTIFLK